MNQTGLQAKNNTPRLRFPEFSGEWEIVSIGKFSIINPQPRKLPHSFIYIDLESVTKGKLIKEIRISADKAPSRAQRTLESHDILFQTVRPYQRNNYFFKSNQDDVVASTGYAQIRTSNNPYFLYQYLHTDRFVFHVLRSCTGTNYPAINSSDLSEIEIKTPTFSEQQKIADFFTSVDDKIASLQNKIDLMKKYKKGIMQQIFAQKIRFRDENGKKYLDWEEKKLGELVEFKNGKPFEDDVTENAQYNLITIDSIDIEGNLKQKHKKTNRNDNSLAKGDIVIVLSDIAHGLLLGLADIIPDNNYVLNQRMGRLRLKRKDSSLFLKILINNSQDFFRRRGQGTSQRHIYERDVNDLEVFLPVYEEQKKIADFLTTIDDIITLEERKLDQAKRFKKSLLQQMFV